MVVSDTRTPEAGDLWRLTMEHSPVGMAIVSTSGDFLTANIALCDMLGYEPDVLATMSFRDVTHPDDLAADLRLVEQALAGEISSYRVTKRYLRSDGRVVIGDLSVALLRDAAGGPVHFISQIADITERQAFVERLDAAEALADDERRTAKAIFDGVPVGLLRIDPDGAYLATNNRMRELLVLAFPSGHDGVAGQAGFVYDRDQLRVLGPEDMPSSRAARGEEFDDLRLWIGEDPDARRALAVSARAVLDRHGLPAGAVLVYHDVTDMVRATNVKDDFVSTVSHELRTPLTSALAYLELLDDSDDVTDEGHHHVTAARRNMLRLSHLVADLLFATRASAGSVLVDPYDVDVVRVLAEAVQAAALDADGARVHLATSWPESLTVRVDGLRLRQVVDNLLANAIAYSPPDGVVDVSVTVEPDCLLLTVTDEGAGIEPHEVGDVFERFFRGQNARRLQLPGTGLGLHIVRTIVEAHGGEVSLDSTAGVGTTVRVTLPL